MTASASTPSTPVPANGRFTIAVALDTTVLDPALTPLKALTVLVRAAEDAGAVAVTLRDRLVSADPHVAGSGLDASIAAAALAPLTRGIGLISEVPSAVSEPFHVATALQTVDHASLGWAGLQLRPGLDGAEHDAVGRWPLDQRPKGTAAPPEASGDDSGVVETVLRDADDTLEAITRLWDSWEEDAVIRDVSTGRFLDRERVHPANFTGALFSIEGASITPRSPQGRPPILVRVDRAELVQLALDRADVVILLAHDPALWEAVTAGTMSPLRRAPVLWAELPLALASPELLAELAGRGFSGVQLIPTAQEQRPQTLHDAVSALAIAPLDTSPLATSPLATSPLGASSTLRAALGLAPALNPYTSARLAAARHTPANTQEDSLV